MKKSLSSFVILGVLTISFFAMAEEVSKKPVRTIANDTCDPRRTPGCTYIEDVSVQSLDSSGIYKQILDKKNKVVCYTYALAGYPPAISCTPSHATQ